MRRAKMGHGRLLRLALEGKLPTLRVEELSRVRFLFAADAVDALADVQSHPPSDSANSRTEDAGPARRAPSRSDA
jgi:hypothetical protein